MKTWKKLLLATLAVVCMTALMLSAAMAEDKTETVEIKVGETVTYTIKNPHYVLPQPVTCPGCKQEVTVIAPNITPTKPNVAYPTGDKNAVTASVNTPVKTADAYELTLTITGAQPGTVQVSTYLLTQYQPDSRGRIKIKHCSKPLGTIMVTATPPSVSNFLRVNVTVVEDTPEPCPDDEHQWVNVGDPDPKPTCGKEGQQLQRCSVCGTEQTVSVPPTGNHFFYAWNVIKKPTCTEPGLLRRHCHNCDAFEEKEDPIDPEAHAWSDELSVIKAATCTEDGEQGYACTNGCGNYKDVTPIAATGHSFGDWKVTTEATCTEAGEEERACSACNEKETREIAATGHSFGDWKVATEATCTEAGKEERACSACNEKETREIAATGHAFGDWKVTKKPTCTEDGEEERVCSACNEKETRVVAAAGAHTWDEGVVVPATCDKNGYTQLTCTACGETTQTNKTAATSHWYEAWTDNGDGTHSAKCLRPDCDEHGTVQCGKYSVAVGEEIWDVCPICGKFGAKVLPIIDGAKHVSVGKVGVPRRGQIVVRGMANPYEGVAYAFTACQGWNGKVRAYEGMVKVTVPVSLENDFSVVRVDVKTEKDVRTETLTEVPFSYENGKLVIETDVAGLFLVIPATK